MKPEEFSEKFLTHLNKQQREATQTVNGAILLLAVPGSGKTTVLVTRLGYMVYCANIDPNSILTMTYTVAATKEMKQRFASMFGGKYADVLEFRTINGLSAKIIDYYSRNHGKRQPFELLDNDGALAQIVRRIFQKINNEYATESTVKDIRTGITYIKNMMLTEEEIDGLDVGVAQMPEIYNQYCAELKRRGLMDYDDQMSYALTILKSVPAVLEHFQDRYRYICVDESQDTSKIQHAIIRILAQKHGNIFMVGDEDQSIYGFRAAYPDALMSFCDDYPSANLLMIEQNYRSSKEIVALANAFVSKNRFRYKKTIVPTRKSGHPINVIKNMDRSGQYKYLLTVAQKCEKETAVLFRNNDSALPLIDVLERGGIPYNCRQFDGVFFSHRVVVDITDIINFAYNPHDTETFMRIYYKLGCAISKKAATYACDQSKRTGKSIVDVLQSFSELSRYTKDGIFQLRSILPKIKNSNGFRSVQLIWNMAGYGKYAADNKLDTGKYFILSTLGEKVSSPRELILRLKELQDIIKNHDNSETNRFILSTIHSSKGLEYDRVFLLDVLDGILPSKANPNPSSQDDIKQYEEDRRLYYVGMTRAKNELYVFKTDKDSCFTDEVQIHLLCDVSNTGRGAERHDQKPSGSTRVPSDTSNKVAQGRRSMPADTGNEARKNSSVQRNNMPRKGMPAWEASSKSVFSEPKISRNSSNSFSEQAKIQLLSETKIGSIVIHKSFGKGIVSKIEKTIVTIQFDQPAGEKRLDLVLAVRFGFLQVHQ